MRLEQLDQASFDFRPTGEAPFQVVGFGMNAVDWICCVPEYPRHNSKTAIDAIHRLGGGPAATATALCGRYGLRAKYVGRVGDDDVGRFSLTDLSQEPINIDDVEVVEGAASQFAVIIVDRPTGERTVLWQRDPALRYRPENLKREVLTGGQVLHMDGDDIASRIQAARWAGEAGMAVSLDIDRPAEGVGELLALVDFALPTEDFVLSLTGCSDWRKGLEAMAPLCRGFLAVTLGAEGSAAFWEGSIVEVPSFPVRTVESTGAGDVFHGAFVYSLFQGWSVGECLRFSNAAGALACTRIGAREGIPPLQEVRRLAEV